MMNPRRLEITVGLFLVAGLAALVFLAMQVGNLDTALAGDGYRVSARFQNIGGLKPKAPVTLAGVRIGRVTDITVDREDFSAVVWLEIERRYDNIPADTSAAILTAGLLGAQYIGLEPGGEDRSLADGDEIELTQSAVVLEHLIGQFLFNKAGE